MREYVAKAMLNKGEALGKLNRPKDAIALYDTLIARFEIPYDPKTSGTVGSAIKAKEALSK